MKESWARRPSRPSAADVGAIRCRRSTGVVLRLGQFGASNGTLFADYLRPFRLLVSSVTGSERALAPSVSMVLEIVGNSASKQFPSLAPMLYIPRSPRHGRDTFCFD